MAYWDRFDICAAYSVVESLWNSGGWLQELPSNVRKSSSVGSRLHAIGFSSGAGGSSWESLSENGKEIYISLVSRLCLPIEREDKNLFEETLGREMSREGLRGLANRLEKGDYIDPRQVDVWSGFPDGTWNHLSKSVCLENQITPVQLLRNLSSWGSYEQSMWSEDGQKRFVELIESISSGDVRSARELVFSGVDLDAPLPDVGLSSFLESVTPDRDFPFDKPDRGVALRVALAYGNPEMVSFVASAMDLKHCAGEVALQAVKNDVSPSCVMALMKEIDVVRDGRDMTYFAEETFFGIDIQARDFSQSVAIGVMLVNEYGIEPRHPSSELESAVRAEMEKNSLCERAGLSEQSLISRPGL